MAYPVGSLPAPSRLRAKKGFEANVGATDSHGDTKELCRLS